MEEAPENGKESSHSAHENGMNEWMNTHAWYYVKHIQKLGAIKIELYLICRIMCSNYANKDDRSRFKLQSLPGSAAFMNFINYYFPVPHVDRYFDKVAVAPVIAIPQQQSGTLTIKYQYNKHCHRITNLCYSDTVSQMWLSWSGGAARPSPFLEAVSSYFSHLLSEKP